MQGLNHIITQQKSEIRKIQKYRRPTDHRRILQSKARAKIKGVEMIDQNSMGAWKNNLIPAISCTPSVVGASGPY